MPNICPVCFEPVAENAVHCPKCGARITPVPQDSPIPRECPQCGSSNPPAASFCTQCGQTLSVGISGVSGVASASLLRDGPVLATLTSEAPVSEFQEFEDTVDSEVEQPLENKHARRIPIWLVLFLVALCCLGLVSGLSYLASPSNIFGISLESLIPDFSKAPIPVSTNVTPQPDQTTRVNVTPVMLATITQVPTLTPSGPAVYTWSVEHSPDSESGTGAMLDVAWNQAANELYIAYFADFNDNLRLANYYGGIWRVDYLEDVVNMSDSNERDGWFTSLATDDVGNPHLAYFAYGSNLLKYVFRSNSGNWSSQKTVASGVKILDLKLALDANNNPYFVYIDARQKALIFTEGVEAYRIDQIDYVGDLENSKEEPMLSFALDKDDHPFIAYSTSEGLKFAWNTDGTWRNILINENGLYPALAVDRTGGIHLVYYDQQETALIYGHLNSDNDNWSFTTIDNNGDTGLYPSIVVTPNGLVYAVYFNASDLGLNYAVGNTTGWNIYEVSKVASAVVDSGLVVDDQNRVHIIYFDKTLQQMQYIEGQVR